MKARVPFWKVALLHAGLTLLCVATLYPVLWVLRLALSPTEALTLSASPIPTSITWEHFEAFVLGRDAQGRWLFGRQLWASLWVSAVSTLIGMALATSAAYALSRLKFPGREAGLKGLVLTQMFPGTLTLIPLYAILEKLGLNGSLWGLVLVYSTTALPFCVWMLKGYFDTLPKELEEAAALDGATTAQVFFRIVLPLSRPALAVTALFSFMTAWNEFILAATLLNDAASFTLPVALQRLVGEYRVEWGPFAAGALLVSLPVMALFFALQRYLVSGLTAGAVKG